METKEILTNKLTALHSSGVSIIRSRATDEEIRLSVRELTEHAAEPQTLVGAVILKASDIRYLDQQQRLLCIYDTDAPSKKWHADIFGTFARNVTKNQAERSKQKMRYDLRDLMMNSIREASSVEELISVVRAAG